MGEMAVMDPRQGDLKIIWDPENEDEVTAAREQFDSLREKGYAAYSVNARGRKGEVVRTFDPASEKIILAPAMVGG